MDPVLENTLLSQEYNLFIFRLKEADLVERLGIRKLSTVIECQPLSSSIDDIDDEVTAALCQRYEVRRIALEKATKTQLPATVDIKAATNLMLKLSTDGQVLTHFSVLSWKEDGEDSILVNIKKNRWHAFAHALAHRLEDDGRYVQHADTFEVYLTEEDDQNVLERLRDAGIPEEAPEEVEKGFQLSSPDERSKEETREEGEEQNVANTDARHSPTGRSGKSTPAFDRTPAEPSEKQPTSPQRGRASTLRPESGLKAEQWLEGQLRKVWPEVRNVHEGRDFAILFDEQTVHIEAKHVESPPGVIHWSDRQYELAERTNRNRDSYFIAVLSPDDENQYAIHWIWDPLKQLKDLQRNVTWSGKSDPTQLRKGDWNVDETRLPNVPSRGFDIEVKLDRGIFHKENQDSSRLEKLIAKVDSLSGEREKGNRIPLQITERHNPAGRR